MKNGKEGREVKDKERVKRKRTRSKRKRTRSRRKRTVAEDEEGENMVGNKKIQSRS